ncbi:MAG: hypothetical protein KGM42_10170 [Hyphomicrobiales bacterium]|nr:hypothetical protein [Hyphomicrobiales bacterium]
MALSPVDLIRPKPLLISLFLCLAAGGAFAAPGSIGDCDAIKDADAYNRCLASFGPAAHIGPAVGETPATSGQRAETPANADRMMTRGHGGGRRWSRRAHSRGYIHARRRGRVTATFDVRSR